MATGIRPDGVIFASGAKEGEVQEFPSLKRGWGVTIDGKDPDGTVITESTNSIPPMEWFNQLQQKTDQNILWLLQNALPDWLAGTWPKGAVVVNGDVVWRAQKETTAEPTASNGDWLELFPLQKLDGRYVPQTRTINGHALTDDVALSASDVGALSVDGGTVNGDLAVSGAQTLTSSASAPTTLTGASPCILFSETDTGKKYYLVVDGSNIRLNEDSTAGTLVWSWDAKNKTFQTGGTFAGSLSGNAASATKLNTARKIGGVAFDGTADINLPGVNTQGNQSTTGNASTATTLATARTVQTNLGSTSAASFNGSANITPGVTGTLAIAHGGTGSTTAAGALSALGADNKYQLKNTASKAANGWHKDTTTGVIVQWGFTNNSSDNNTYIKFPIAFPSACTTCVTIPKGSAGWSPNLVQFVFALSKTACNISAHDNNTSRGQYWIAYGY